MSTFDIVSRWEDSHLLLNQRVLWSYLSQIVSDDTVLVIELKFIQILRFILRNKASQGGIKFDHACI